MLRNDLTDGNLQFALAATLTDNPNPVVVLSDFVDDDGRTTEDLVTIGEGGGGGRPPPPFGPRSLENIRAFSSAANAPCPADFNRDGFVDFFDLDDYISCFEGDPCPPKASADFNRDGFVDFFDLDDFIAAFEAGCS